MTFITVSQGGPSADNDIPDGVYAVILTDIKDPRTVTARRGPKAGQDIDLMDWIFAIHKPGSPLHDRIIEGVTSTASGPRSKMFAWLTALLGGKPPQVNQQFAKTDLVARMAVATISHDEGGWPQINSLGAMLEGQLGQGIAEATGAPTNQPVAAAGPIRQDGEFAGAPRTPPLVGAATGAGSDDLPF